MATVELSSCAWALTGPEEDALDTITNEAIQTNYKNLEPGPSILLQQAYSATI